MRKFHFVQITGVCIDESGRLPDLKSKHVPAQVHLYCFTPQFRNIEGAKPDSAISRVIGIGMMVRARRTEARGQKRKNYCEDEIQVSRNGAMRNKKKNYSEKEIQVIINGVERKRSIICETSASGVRNFDKAYAWKEITNNVNAVSTVQR